MLKKFINITLAVAVICLGVYLLYEPQNKITNYPSLGTDILGVSGETTAGALNRLGQVSKYKPKVIILLLGGNDFLSHVPEEETFGNLDRIIETIQQTGAVVLLVGMENGPIGNKHKKLFEELAEKRGTAYAPDILGGIFGHSQLMSDSLHPNDEGYRIIADRIKSVLEELL